MRNEVIDQTLEEGTKGRRTAYRISALIASFIFLVCFYINMVPGMYPRDQLLLSGSAAIVPIASLTVGLWGLRMRKAPLTQRALDRVIGIVLIAELAVCVLAISELLPLVLR